MSGEGLPFSVPAAFGRFRVLHQIGAGSLGPVFRAEDPTDGRSVAVKLIRLNLPPEKAHDVAEGLRAVQERLPAHPAVAAILGAGLHEVSPYVVYTFATGQSLDVALREFGPAVLPDALPRLRDLASGLDACAESWSWHGNLHARDIVIDDDHTLLVGIGVAPIVERTGARVPMRRPYTAPEVVDGRPTSPASDQYALAAVAFEWLFGRRAPGPANAALQTPVLPGVDREALSAAFTTALAEVPAARFESCSAFVEALAGAVRESGLASKSDTRRKDGERAMAAPLPLLDEEPAVAGHDDHDEDAHAVARAEVAAVADAVADLLIARTEAEPEALPPAPVILPDATADDTVISAPPATYEPFVAEPYVVERKVDTARLAEPVAWQGSLGTVAPEPSPGRRFGLWALVAALVIGVGIGALVVAALLRSGAAPSAPLASREFTDAPLAADGGAGAATGAPATGKQPEAPAPAESSVAPAARTGPPPSGAATEAAVSSGGRLLIRSTPSGAEVTVNGIDKGETPLSLRDLPLGTHTVVVARPGFSRVEQRITLTRARPSRSVDARLAAERQGGAPAPARPAARPATATSGGLTIESRPAGAVVTIDGRQAGTTPVTLTDVAPGEHTVRITLPGYRAWTTTVMVEAGKRARVAGSLAVAGQ